MRDWITQLRKGVLEFCVLNVLASGENYGYQLIQRLQGIKELAVTESTAYPLLNRLREDGYVGMRIEPSSAGPPRRYYALTDLGQRRVKEMNSYWHDLSESIRRIIADNSPQEVSGDAR